MYHKPVERSLVGVYLLQDGRFIYTNPRLSEILGLRREELENSPIIRYIHAEDVEMVLPIISESSRIQMKPMITNFGESQQMEK
jgi:PAS domain S-box-containing protein